MVSYAILLFNWLAYFCASNIDMRSSRWLAIFSAILLIVSFYLPWFSLASKSITVTGFDTTGT
jgi:hypothetical protein